MAIRAGVHEVVAVIGCQKMTELSTAEILALMGRVGEVQWESVFGTTFPGYYAMFAHRHMHEFGTTREQLAAVAVKNHHYGAMNPNALFRKEITLEKARGLRAGRLAASRLRLLRQRRRRGLRDPRRARTRARAHAAARRSGSTGMGAATASMSVLRRAGPGRPAERAPRGRAQAYAMAGVAPRDVQVAEVHDCFTIAEIMAYEDLGFCEKGEGGRLHRRARSPASAARSPVNVDGGLKAKGHPIGATGVSMTYEIVKQLRGERRRAPGAGRATSGSRTTWAASASTASSTCCGGTD